MTQNRIKSVRALARELGISHTTVSDALRNNPRVSEKTRERVHKAAREMGYHYNPLAGAIMSEIRKSTVGAFRGVVAIVDLDTSSERTEGATIYHGEIMKGAKAAAGRLGFKVDHFILGDEHISVSRLNSILESRGIRGILILPVLGKPSVSSLDWSNLTGIYTDYLIDDPPLHSVCPSHFRSMTIALEEVLKLGYKRPGLVLHKAHDRRLLFRWEAAYSTYLGHRLDVTSEPLIASKLTRECFIEWFEETQPDVVMCHRGEVLDWMKEHGCKVPETHGFCCLNVISANIKASGLDLLPRVCGTRAMETLIAQLHRNECGIPDIPSTVNYPAEWRDGPTLKRQD